jgi:hypothetical protein
MSSPGFEAHGMWQREEAQGRLEALAGKGKEEALEAKAARHCHPDDTVPR